MSKLNIFEVIHLAKESEEVIKALDKDGTLADIQKALKAIDKALKKPEVKQLFHDVLEALEIKYIAELPGALPTRLT